VGVLHTSGNVAAEMPLLPLWTSELEVPLTLTVDWQRRLNRIGKACGGRQGRLCEDYSSGSSGPARCSSRGIKRAPADAFPTTPVRAPGSTRPYRHGLEPRASSRAVCGRSDGSLARHASTIPSSSLRNRQFCPCGRRLRHRLRVLGEKLYRRVAGEDELTREQPVR